MGEQKYKDDQIIEVSLDSLVRDENQPREFFDEEDLSSLANSISKDGLIQYITVRPSENGKFKIVTGERRFRAIKKLYAEGDKFWSKITVVVKNVDDKKARKLALAENIHRNDLLPLELANGLEKYKERKGFNTQKQLAEDLHWSEQHVSNILKLLKLDDSIKNEIKNNKKYTLHNLIPVASKRTPEAQKEEFAKLKKKVEKSKEKIKKIDIPKTPEQIEANSSRLFGRCATEVKNLYMEPDENYEKYKFKVAETIRASLDCLEKLSKVKDAILIDLNKEFTLNDLKKTLDDLIALKPKNETETEQVSEPGQVMPAE